MSLFVDHVKITCKAGNGGNGCVSFHREKYVITGGPDGGDGGVGGNIVFYADPNMHTLLDFRFKTKYEATPGGNGSGNRCTGKDGEDLVIKVPAGTIVKDADTGNIVADMFHPGESRILLHGGRGGWGNSHFATATRQAPNFAKPGIRTDVHTFLLELKTIADVGLVGYPNVGKSTILSVVTAAKPKIANYHFTTLTPNLGIVRHHGNDFVMADIPGLVEGASEGVGLGHDFLRHVERTRLLLHVVDISGCEGRDPVEDFEQINKELAAYGELSSRPQILVCNKCDLPEAEENLERMRQHIAGRDIPMFAVSAATHKGFDALLTETSARLAQLPELHPYEIEEIPLDEKLTNDFNIEIVDGVYEVQGAAAVQLVNAVNFENDESINYFHRTLRRMGIIDALRKKGASEGDTVRIDEMEFDFIE